MRLEASENLLGIVGLSAYLDKGKCLAVVNVEGKGISDKPFLVKRDRKLGSVSEKILGESLHHNSLFESLCRTIGD